MVLGDGLGACQGLLGSLGSSLSLKKSESLFFLKLQILVKFTGVSSKMLSEPVVFLFRIVDLFGGGWYSSVGSISRLLLLF